jgi:hypothetical protein
MLLKFVYAVKEGGLGILFVISDAAVIMECQNRGLNTGPPENTTGFSLLLSQLSYSG